MKKTLLHVVTWKERKIYIAKLLELELASQGKTRDEAIKNLKEAYALYSDMPEQSTPLSFLPIENPSTRSVLFN